MLMRRAGMRSEWRIVIGHPLVWVVAIGAVVFLAVATGTTDPSTDRERFEALTRMNLLIPVLVLPFVAGALAPVFFLREIDHRTHELFAACPQTRADWLRVRLSAFFALLVAIAVGQQAMILTGLASGHADTLPAALVTSAQLFAVVHLPACLIWACGLAWVSGRTASSALVYCAAGFGWLAYVGVATVTGTPLIAGSIMLWQPLHAAMMLLDPYAITAWIEPAWEIGGFDARRLALAMGRVLWLGACWLLVRGITELPVRKARGRERADRPAVARRGPWSRPFAGHATVLARASVGHRLLLLASIGWIVLIFPEIFGGMAYSEPLMILTPDSRDALNRVMWDMLPAAGWLLLLFAADRLCRIAGVVGMAELTAATPRRSWRILTVQVMLLWAAAAALVAVTLATTLAAQLAARSAVQPEEYLQQGAQALVPMLLVAVVLVAVHGAVRSRIAANVCNVAIVVVGQSSFAAAIGLRHPLSRPLSILIDAPDHLLGLGDNWIALGSFSLVWGPVCLAALILAVLIHHRGVGHGRPRWRASLRHPAMTAIPALLGLAAWQGMVIDRTLRAEGTLPRPADGDRWRVDYEKRFAAWAGRPQPDVAAVRALVVFRPDGRTATLSGTMRLINRASVPIERILVGRNQTEVAGHAAIDAAHVEWHDAPTGQTVFTLDTPMRPGELRDLRFNLRYARSGLMPPQGLVVLHPAFGSLPAFQMLPIVGFRPEFTLRDARRRHHYRLPQTAVTLPSRIAPEASGWLASGQARFDTTVVTPLDRYGVAPGERTAQWTDGRHRYARYRTDRPIRNVPAFFALSWPATHLPTDRLTIAIHATRPVHPDDPLALGTRDTLAWLDRRVAPYPGRTLRVIAVPDLGFSGFALPQAILLSDRLAFRSRRRHDAGFDQAYRRAAHETAHQWFGHLLGYGNVDEHAFLIESLAKYVELVMLDQRYGARATRALVAYERDRYSRARLAPASIAVALIDADDTEDMYSRATLAFDCLRRNVGDEAIVKALRRTATESRLSGRAARSLDFVEALRRASPATATATIDRLLIDAVPVDAALTRSGCGA